MSKPTYEELALKIKAQETTIESLKQDELQLRQFFDSVPKNVKIIELIKEGNEDVKDYYYRYVNKSFTELVGKTKSQLIGKRYKELFEPVDSYWLEIYNEIERKGTSINYKNKKTTNGRYYEIFAWEIQKKNNRSYFCRYYRT
jgi:PAS domain S-box-containing protein